MKSIYVTTLGCPKNMVDSRHLTEAFSAEGFETVEDPEKADFILVNTCGFIQDAKEESIGEILKLVDYKSAKKSKKTKLLVFGCLAQRYRDELLNEIPEIDGIWGVGQDSEIIEYCKNPEDRKAGSTRHGSREDRKIGSKEKKQTPTLLDIRASALPRLESSFAYLKIAEGCDKKCTFCVIPSIRGKFRSISRESILEEARAYVRGGVKELILVAQDILNYGKESKGYDFLSLLKDLAAIKGDFWIRLLYLYPTEITDELLDFIAAEEKICKYLDIPLQHSEDRILRLMGRRGTRKEYTKLIRTIRRKIPGITLRTTFISGFPSETEEDFRGMVDFIEEMRFERLGVFTFSKEEGTPSAKLKEQLPEKVKKRRMEEIMGIQAAISLEKNKELVGKSFRAIVDEADNHVVIARLASQSPEIDGVVIIERSKDRQTGRTEVKQIGRMEARKFGSKKETAGNATSALPSLRTSELAVGEFINVEIVDAYDYDLKGKVIAG
jgi:ribosomal protein S12 methylthiotransferase